MNKKGSALLIVILILVIVVLVFIYPLGRGKDIEKITDKFEKLKCPDLQTNLTCEYGIDLYSDDRGCPQSKCKTNEIVDTGLGTTGTLQVFFVDVRQGDGIYIETPEEKRIVIDSGRGDYMSDFLVFKGIDKIDWMISTHPDADHIGGMDEILESSVVLNFAETETPCDTDTCIALDNVAEEEEGMLQHQVYSGFVFEGLDLQWEVINPNRDLIFEDKNDDSIVIKLTYGEVEILFTGDCGGDCEEMLILLDKDISADVLKVGHHGSKSSTSAHFLQRVNPAYAVLSYGDTNPYGHPSKEVLDRLVMQDVNIVRTASAGTIELRTDGQKVEWYCEKKADCFT
jgi:beta-lactamase superfamily II metal-dependent hydrolase